MVASWLWKRSHNGTGQSVGWKPALRVGWVASSDTNFHDRNTWTSWYELIWAGLSSVFWSCDHRFFSVDISLKGHSKRLIPLLLVSHSYSYPYSTLFLENVSYSHLILFRLSSYPQKFLSSSYSNFSFVLLLTRFSSATFTVSLAVWISFLMLSHTSWSSNLKTQLEKYTLSL